MRELIDTKLFEDLTTELAARGHRVRFRARGNSMNPLIADGAVLTVESADARAAVGEVWLYRSDRGPTAHRIVQDRGEVLCAAGTCRYAEKESVSSSLLMGRVVRVEQPFASRVKMFYQRVRRWLRRDREVIAPAVTEEKVTREYASS